MPVYLYWGNDDFAIARAVTELRQLTLDPAWETFNYNKYSPDQPDAIMQGLNQVMTSPFGSGHRFVWLLNSTLCQRCPDEILAELERTLPFLPETSVLLITSPTKPDGRLKSTKLLQKHAEIREFALIPPWKTELLVKQVQAIAREVGVQLTPAATDLLAESLGNNTRQLYSELEKLQLYASTSNCPIDETAIALLVTASTQNTLKLAAAIRQGQTADALELVAELLRQNEPALVIARGLIGQFRRWVWVKLMVESGERDERAIAQAVELENPKRFYYLKQEVQSLSLNSLLKTLPLLLDLELTLKRSTNDLLTLQTKIIELCQACRGEGVRG